MRRTKRTERVTIRLAEPLRHELEAEAEEDGRTLAEHIRRVLQHREAALFKQPEHAQ